MQETTSNLAKPRQQFVEGELVPRLYLFYVHRFNLDAVQMESPLEPPPRGWVEVHAKDKQEALDVYLKSTYPPEIHSYDIASSYPYELLKENP